MFISYIKEPNPDTSVKVGALAVSKLGTVGLVKSVDALKSTINIYVLYTSPLSRLSLGEHSLALDEWSYFRGTLVLEQ